MNQNDIGEGVALLVKLKSRWCQLSLLAILDNKCLVPTEKVPSARATEVARPPTQNPYKVRCILIREHFWTVSKYGTFFHRHFSKRRSLTLWIMEFSSWKLTYQLKNEQWWYDLSYAKGATNQNDIVRCVLKRRKISYQTKTDLLAIEVADDDMI